MSDIRRTHPGYFSVTLGLALPWYIGLGVCFTFFGNSKLTSATAYDLISSYVPLWIWGIAYLSIGLGLLAAILIRSVRHETIRILTGIGLALTSAWIVCFVISGVIGQLDAASVIPAWCTVACVEWAAMTEPEHGPKTHP